MVSGVKISIIFDEINSEIRSIFGVNLMRFPPQMTRFYTHTYLQIQNEITHTHTSRGIHLVDSPKKEINGPPGFQKRE